MNDFKSYWAQQTSSGHRFDHDEYYRQKAGEHLLLMSQEDRLSGCVDLGCGAGELLGYLSNECAINVALDFSEVMLEKARNRLSDKNIKFMNEDVFSYLKHSVDSVWIAVGSINQYLDAKSQFAFLDLFVDNSLVKSLYLFDCIDPSRYVLFAAGAINRYDLNRPQLWLHRTVGFGRGLVRALFQPSWFDFAPLGHMGYGFAPGFWRRECERRDLRIELISSRFYEYRYHAIIRK
jgi:cyclopropane-fatty-acyl-phospholipid synthase